MTATILEIVEKLKSGEAYPSLPQNFVTREAGSIDARVILTDPNVSLYCLDDVRRCALFVETPTGIDAARAPFFYVEQYRHAQRLIAVPYDTFHELAQEAGMPDDLILIYSVGRCGSTLISGALNAVDGVLSLSEPDVYSQINMLRLADSSRDEEYTRLLKSCTQILVHGSRVAAVKFRSGCIHLGDLMQRAFPNSKNLFLYRNANTWAQSMNSAFSGDAPLVIDDPVFLQFLMSIAPLTMPFIGRHGRPPMLTEAYALVWLSVMDKYLLLYGQGIAFYSVRYEDIKAHPQRVLRAVFEFLGLATDAVEAAYGAFSRDSQEGTALSRENRERNAVQALGADDYVQVAAVLGEHPVIQRADFIAPGTVSFDA